MSTSIPYNPKTAALLVIDMQEIFRNDATDIIPNVQSLVKSCHEKGVPVFWTQHGHRNPEFDGGALRRWWGDRLIKWGSDEWQILKEMQPFVSRSQTSLDTLDFIIKSKTRYDAFYKTELNSLLISLGIETLIISGVRTNLCCETTARRGFDKNYDIVFIKDATATENQKMHEATLLNMEYGWAKIVTAIDVIEWLAHIGKT
ncbi:Isochorismatase-like protein [Rhizophagus diaphanus]|nr:Isochorismatase-like protein [Rhizophagus diaphanus] [Rhizophagus sp. MUCL 43196]